MRSKKYDSFNLLIIWRFPDIQIAIITMQIGRLDVPPWLNKAIVKKEI